MRILLLNQFYPPDVAPTGHYLHDVARELVRRGHAVTAVCSRRAYDGGQSFPRHDIRDGVRIHRLAAFGFGRRTFAGKLLDYGSFASGLMLNLLTMRPPPHAIVALTTPPYLGLLARSVARRRGIPHLHWVMDLYPDVLAAHGALAPDRASYRLLQALPRRQFRGSRLVLGLSPDMAERLAPYVLPADFGAAEGTATVPHVPLWATVRGDAATAADAAALRQSRGWTPADMVMMYSGNLGLGHRFQEFLEAAVQLQDDRRLLWVFAGGGRQLPAILAFARQHPGLRIAVLPYCPPDQLAAHLASADVLLASLDARWQGGIVPSKLQNAFAVGRPV
ncbi:MAG: glycosyltransferase family 4 protein, partial [Ignavibacteria bacterium]|nr:glycosyltransferase family 4 protein [Ignavibacteria bacterium]